ncbi:hypothetical protein BV898_03825 [Hypsibius exemplaris]|uniref:Platelet-derived growth factor (PDGF) family profile domain-containing protein n=1 Tax=Hypsibius exemplaris TaxID=2072580 RepID=A0A1W0X457_HYPEX|nr:hypothetical protein BV898_03825 [Hypsibius exemplaris]
MEVLHTQRSRRQHRLTAVTFIALFFSQILANGPDVPMDLMKELASMESTSAVLERYGGASALYPVGGSEPEAVPVMICIGNRPCENTPTRSNVRKGGPSRISLQMPQAVDNTPLAENAGCAPTETVIEMPKPNASVVIYPLGTKVKRCSGICGHNNLLCRPTKTQTFIRKGLILVYREGKLVPVGHQNFTLEDHLACSCDCFQKQTDCHAHQRYEANNCRCVCKQDLAQSCGPQRIWDSKTCQCKCPNVCSTCPFGMYFDHSYQCACVAPQGRMDQRSPGRRN